MKIALTGKAKGDHPNCELSDVFKEDKFHFRYPCFRFSIRAADLNMLHCTFSRRVGIVRNIYADRQTAVNYFPLLSYCVQWYNACDVKYLPVTPGPFALFGLLVYIDL